MGHFVSSPRERERRDRRDSRGDERELQGRKRKMNESEEIKKIHPHLLPVARIAGLAQHKIHWGVQLKLAYSWAMPAIKEK